MDDNVINDLNMGVLLELESGKKLGEFWWAQKCLNQLEQTASRNMDVKVVVIYVRLLRRKGEACHQKTKEGGSHL